MVLPIDLSQVILHSQYDSYKNISVNRGDIALATSIGSTTTTLATEVVTLSVSPTYLKIYYYAYNWLQAIGGGGTTKQWWNAAMGGTHAFGVYSTTDGDYLNYGINAKVSGSTVTLTASIFNPYAHTSTLTAQTISYVLIDYTTVQ